MVYLLYQLDDPILFCPPDIGLRLRWQGNIFHDRQLEVHDPYHVSPTGSAVYLAWEWLNVDQERPIFYVHYFCNYMRPPYMKEEAVRDTWRGVAPTILLSLLRQIPPGLVDDVIVQLCAVSAVGRATYTPGPGRPTAAQYAQHLVGYYEEHLGLQLDEVDQDDEDPQENTCHMHGECPHVIESLKDCCKPYTCVLHPEDHHLSLLRRCLMPE